jgi:D-alanyl-D-alanine dipeptidase
MAMGRRIGSMIVVAFAMLATGVAAGEQLPKGFVYLRDVAPTIRQDMRYAGTYNFTGSTVPGYQAAACILTRPVAAALRRVQTDLRRLRLSLKVYDCYRPARAVRFFLAWARDPARRDMKSAFFPRVLKRDVVRRGFVAPRSTHSTGNAVDLTIVRARARPAPKPVAGQVRGSCIAPMGQRPPDNSLDMGTGYDCFDVLSHTNSPKIKGTARGNRQLLVRVMARHGFRNYRREWWHFDYVLPLHQRRFDFPVRAR